MGVGVGVVDGGVVLFGFGGEVVISVFGVTDGVTEGGGVVEVNSASGVSEVISGVTEAISGVTVGVREVVLVLWRRYCGPEPS